MLCACEVVKIGVERASPTTFVSDLILEAHMTSPRRFPPPWHVEQAPGGFKVLDANGQALIYVYARETKAEADIAKVLTIDEARRVAA